MKTIQIGNRQIKITAEYEKRIREAMAETQRKLDKELTYPEDLRHNDMVESYRAHIKKLEEYLA